jgi:hypothetical protein
MILAYLLIMFSAGALGLLGKRCGLRASVPIAILLGVVLCVALTAWLEWRVKHGPYP